MCAAIWWQELPEAFLSKTPYIREALLLPALANRNEKIIAGLACLMCEVGQAVRFFIIYFSFSLLIIHVFFTIKIRKHINIVLGRAFDFSYNSIN
jgi:hypothetical protein